MTEGEGAGQAREAHRAGPAGQAHQARQTGWALKQACYDAWHRDPPAAQRAAQDLAALAAAHPDDEELQGLAAWTAAIAALTEGQLQPALGLLQTAQRSFEARGAGALAAETRVPQIMVLAMLGREAEAQACAEAALALFVAAGDERSAGKVELNLGTLLVRQDRHAEAEPRFRRAALRFAKVGDVELSIVADSTLANVLGWQSRFEEALQMFERARLRAAPRGLGVLVAQMQQCIGQIELHRGRWHHALHQLAAAARGAEKTGAPPAQRIETEAVLADAYLAVRLLAEAVRLYDHVIAEASQLGMPTDQAWATLQRARAHALLGDTQAASQGFDASAQLYAAAGNRTVLGLVNLEQGRLALALGDVARAAGHAEAAQAALQDCGVVGWQLEGRVLAAATAAAAGRHEEAAGIYQRVLADAAGPPALPQPAWLSHAGLGALAHGQERHAEARLHLEQALALVAQVRSALPGDELRSALAREATEMHDRLLAVGLAQGDAAALLVDMERGRGRSLAQGLAELQLPGTGPAQASNQAVQLRWLRQQWRQTLAEGDTSRAPALAARVLALEQELLETHRRAGLVAPALGARATDSAEAAASQDSPFTAEDIAALQRTLGPDRALVAYHLLGATLLAVVVTDSGVAHHSWAVPGLAEQVAALRFQLQAPRHGGELAQRHGALLRERARRRLQDLHAAVWAPLQPLLGGRRRCVLLPHRELHYVPFAALHDGQRWLVQDHELAWAPSAAVWLALQQRPAPRFASALVLGVADVGLPQVHEEARRVAAAFGSQGRLLLDGQATQAALAGLAQAEVPPDVLHLACHAQFRADSPAFSALHLGDGPMSLLDLAQLRLPPDLVALSACETGASRVAPGEELQGLVRGCLLAGTAAVLASFWAVEDSATAALAVRFYAGLQEGLAPAAALQRAQAEAAEAGAHPFFWAGLALHGRA